MSYKQFKEQLKSMGGVESVSQSLDQLSGNTKDDRFWKPEWNDKKESFSIIRFLPAPFPEKDPVVKIMTYFIEGPGGRLIANSPAAIGRPDPIKEYVAPLWDTDEDQAKELSPRIGYVANILVIRDKIRPENEGRVFLYRFGKQIFDKIKEKLKPLDSSEDKVNIFNFKEGCNFKLKTYLKGQWPAYDTSEFSLPSSLCDGDDELLEKIYDSLYPLQPFKDESLFKPYEELKAEFQKVMGFKIDAVSPKRVSENEEEEDDIPASYGNPKPKTVKKPAPVTDEDEELEEELEDEDDVPAPVKKPVLKPTAKPLVKKPAPVVDEEDEELEDEDDIPAPVKKPVAKPLVKKPAPVVEEDEELEEDEEDAPAPVKKPSVKPKKDPAISEEDMSFFDEDED